MGRFVFRKDAESLKQVEDIAQGTGMADLVNDLKDLAELVGKHPDLFKKIPGVKGDVVTRLKALAQILETGRDDSAATEALRQRNLT